MALAVKQNKAAGPVHIGLLGANGIVQRPDALAQQIQQPGLLRRCGGGHNGGGVHPENFRRSKFSLPWHGFGNIAPRA